MPQLIMDEFPTSLSVESNTESEESQTVAPEETIQEESTTEPTETLAELETLSEKTDDAIPLKKFMAEKNARRDAEQKAKTLEAEITRLNASPLEKVKNLDVSEIASKHGIDEEVLRDIIQASSSMTREQVKKELEQEFNPKLAEFESIKKEKAVNDFSNKFNTLLTNSLTEMPEYKDIVDAEDLKTWVKSGQYSKLSLPQLIEMKYSRFVGGKKTTENGYTASRETEMPDLGKMQEGDYERLNSDPAFKKKWADSLPDRLRSIL